MDVNNDWLERQLGIMNSDTRMYELCKCPTKTPEWKYHKEYCPIWKNGRIAELEYALVVAHDVCRDLERSDAQPSIFKDMFILQSNKFKALTDET